MKNKKTFMGLAVLIAVLMLGIGYAAISEIQLSISGSASSATNDDNFTVVFTAAAPKENNAFVVADQTKVNADATTATMTVEGLTAKGDKAVATFTVQNKSADLSALINNIKAELTEGATKAAETANFKIETTLVEQTVNAGKSATFEVSVELLKTPISDADVSTATISVTFDATPIQPGA